MAPYPDTRQVGYLKMKRIPLLMATAAGLLLGVAGCTHLVPPEVPEAAEAAPAGDPLAAARRLYEQGDFREALIECVEIGQRNPTTPGLAELRNRIMTATLEQRANEVVLDRESSRRHMALEALRAGTIPESFGLRRLLPDPPADEPGSDSVRRVLQTPITMHLTGANLPMIISALAGDTNINIIADANLGEGKTIDVEIDNVPLRDLLNYIARNFGIGFYYGRSMIWATSAEAAGNPVLETRMIQLRNGVHFQGKDWGVGEKAAGRENDIDHVSYKATVLPTETSYIEQVIQDFVPEVAGAKLRLDHTTHTLFVHNTPENLELIEEIVAALDINPPQVLIEARFIEIAVSDLKELGVEWILNSPVVVSTTALEQDGTLQDVTRSQIDPGGAVQFDPYHTDEEGIFPLGPQGSFGLDRSGNVPTAGQGLNLTYRGVLTEPMFEAVIHAIEVSGKGQLISVPRVTTLNNSPAKLRSGEDLLYFDKFHAQAFNLVDQNNQRFQVSVLIPEGEPKLEELGVTLVAVPSVGADRRRISLLLTPTISELEGFVSYQNFDAEAEEASNQNIQQVVAKLPIFTRREIQTKLVVDSGQTVVLGGLINTVSQETVERIPVLGSLPLVGPLFRRTDMTEENKNLLVFVTATCISERGESLLAGPQTDGAGAEAGVFLP